MEAGAGHDWMTQLGESYVKKNLVNSVLRRGRRRATCMAPRRLPGLALGLEFGKPPKGKAGY